MFPVFVFAGQIVSIKGEKMQGSLKKITFEKDSAILYFDNGLSFSEDMSVIDISFNYADRINSVHDISFSILETSKNHITVRNAKKGDIVNIFNLHGLSVMEFKIKSLNDVIDISSLKNGVYIIKIEKKVVKLVKK